MIYLTKFIKGSKTSSNIGELDTGGDLTGEAKASSGNNVAKDCKLGNASVLGFDLAEAIKAGL